MKGYSLIETVVAFSLAHSDAKRGSWSGSGSTLVAAASRGDLALVRRCLLGRTNLQAAADDSGPFCGPSPLGAAATAGALEVCEFLLRECGADPDKTDGAGLTAFQRACFSFRLPVMVFLAREGGADVSKPVLFLRKPQHGQERQQEDALTPLALLDRFIGFDAVKPLLIRLGASPLDLRRPLSAEPLPGPELQAFEASAATSALPSPTTSSASASASAVDQFPFRLEFDAASPAGLVLSAMRARAWERRKHLVLDYVLTLRSWCWEEEEDGESLSTG